MRYRPGGGQELSIEAIDIDLSLLSLLVADLGVEVDVGTRNGGNLDIDLAIGLINLIRQNLVPSAIEVEATRFLMDGIVDFFLASASADPTMNPLVAPLLKQISMGGELNGDVKLRLDTRDPTYSEGSVNLAIAGGLLRISDPGLNIADQEFEKFLIKADMKRGKLQLDEASGIKSQELTIGLNGTVDLKEQLTNSLLELNLSLKLEKGLKEQFGFIVEAAMGGRDGQAKMRILGSILQPRTVNIL